MTVYERADRIGGHSNTILAPVGGRSVPVDTGFIVFNRKTYPNLTALFELLGVPTQVSDMSFAVSMDGGTLEYSGSGLLGLFGQPRNLFRPRFWSMLADLARFYRQAPRDAALTRRRSNQPGRLSGARPISARRSATIICCRWQAPYGRPRRTKCSPILPPPLFASTTITVCCSSGSVRPGRPSSAAAATTSIAWLVSFADKIRLDTGVREVRRFDDRVIITDLKGRSEAFDHVVMASHADQALAMLTDPSLQRGKSARLVPL